jgi:hypothetical protein
LLQKLVNDATQALPETRVAPRYRRHAYVAAGWARLGGDFRPYLAHVSNFLDREGNPLSTLRERFEGFASFLRDEERFRLLIAGQHLRHDERVELERNIRRGVKRGLQPHEISRLLVVQARQTAATNRSVGRGLLVTAIPRKAVTAEQESPLPGQIILASPPGGLTSTFLYLSPSDDEGVQYGPIYVCEGRQMKNFEARAL